MLAALGACYRTSSAADQPSPVADVSVVNGRRSGEDVRPRRFLGIDAIPTRSGGFFVKIHSGLVGAGAPLYVIDGAPVLVESSRGIDWMKLEDVLQIRVLKDPSETTVYGARGVNGVILITTRQAPRQGSEDVSPKRGR
jgi:TonB-dependent SusC/RagA subfamily outer membrane receptor